MATHQETSQPTMQANKKPRLFILTGAMIAVAALAVCTLWLSTVAGEKRHSSFDGQLITATDLARDMLERIKSAEYDAIVSVNYPQEDYGSIAAHETFRRTVTINDHTPDPHAKTVTVAVSWRDQIGVTYHVPLSTIITQ